MLIGLFTQVNFFLLLQRCPEVLIHMNALLLSFSRDVDGSLFPSTAVEALQAVQRQQRRGAEVLGMKTPAQLVFGLWKHQRLYDQALGFLERVLPLLRAAILPQPTRRAQT